MVGLLGCGRCGRRLLAADGGKAKPWRDPCRRATLDDGVPGGRRLAGAFLERFVADQVMPVLQPAALELSLAAAQTRRADREP